MDLDTAGTGKFKVKFAINISFRLTSVQHSPQKKLKSTTDLFKL